MYRYAGQANPVYVPLLPCLRTVIPVYVPSYPCLCTDLALIYPCLCTV